MSSQEQAEPMDTEKKYTEQDMLEAFLHGRFYEPTGILGDIDAKSLPEKNRPFWEWLKLRDKEGG